MGDGHVRVEGELDVDVERPGADGGGQLLGLRDPVDQADEDHRRDRPEGAGAAQVHVERRPGLGDLGEVLLDGREVVGVDLGRRDERDVGRDQRGRRVDARPVDLELGWPRAPGSRGRLR